jgi:hypothetical protein
VQGIIFIAKQNVIFLVTTICQPEDEVEFNRWYSEVHIPSVFACEEVKADVGFKFSNPFQRYL